MWDVDDKCISCSQFSLTLRGPLSHIHDISSLVDKYHDNNIVTSVHLVSMAALVCPGFLILSCKFDVA